MTPSTVGSPTRNGYLAVPASGRGPGVLVLHAWWGLTSTFTDVCDRLAEVGFVAFAPDLYGDKTASTVEDAQALLDNADFPQMEIVALSALEYLRAHSAVVGTHVGTLGFSMGGAWAIHLASLRPDNVAATVIFYGSQTDDFAASRAAYQGHFAADDPWEPLDGVQQMEANIRAAGRDVQFHIYPDAGHWFFEPDRPEYQAQAAQLAWQRTIAFLEQHVKR